MHRTSNKCIHCMVGPAVQVWSSSTEVQLGVDVVLADKGLVDDRQTGIRSSRLFDVSSLTPEYVRHLVSI